VLDKSLSSTPHLGCEELAKAIEQIRPRLNIFGHIHGGHGQMTANGTPRYFAGKVCGYHAANGLIVQ
jgi:Icc-related predicted phosphoesterase